MARWSLIICLVLTALAQINANGSTTVQDAIKSHMQSTATVVKEQTTVLKGAVEQKKAGLTDRVKTDELMSVLGGLQGKLDELSSAAGFVLDSTISTAVTTITTAVTEIQKLVTNVVGILDGVVKALQEVLDLVLNLVGTLLNILGNVLASLLGSLGNVLTGLLTQVKTLADGLITNVQDVLHLQLSNINNAVDSILDILEPKFLGDVVNTLTQPVASALAAVLDILGRAGNLVSYLLDSLLYEVFGLLGFVGDTLHKVLSSVVSTLGGTLQVVASCPSCLNGALSAGNGGGLGQLLGGSRRRRSVPHPRAH